MARTTNYFETRASSGDFTKIIDKETILTSIRNIITTPKNARIFLPGYGVDLYKYLFEPLDDITRTQLTTELYRNIATWEDRAIINDITVEQDLVNMALRVNISFSYLGDDYEEPITLTQDVWEEIKTDFEIPISEQLGL